jgi:toxin-antitoxin system PIN domain toxin
LDSPFLLDVNALIALVDAEHIFHVAAHRWFSEAKTVGWATCSVAESGLLRVMSNPNYGRGPRSIIDIAARLQEAKQEGHWRFWNDSQSPAEWVYQDKVLVPSSQMTDAHLLKLAVANGGSLATFDLNIAPRLIGSKDPAIVQHIPI